MHYYIYVYLGIFVYMNHCECVCLFPFKLIHMQVCAPSCARLGLYKLMYIYEFAFPFIRKCIHMWFCVSVFLHVHVYVNT